MKDTEEEIMVKWVNKHGIPMDIKTRRGGLIHALWLAEHEKRNRSGDAGRGGCSKHISKDNVIEIQPEILE